MLGVHHPVPVHASFAFTGAVVGVVDDTVDDCHVMSGDIADQSACWQLVGGEVGLAPTADLHGGGPDETKFEHIVFEPFALGINTVASGS